MIPKKRDNQMDDIEPKSDYKKSMIKKRKLQNRINKRMTLHILFCTLKPMVTLKKK
jgi:hypothetical protein